ncbi:29318_t:CDS:2, partial [Gigaspora margarita]
MFYIHVIVEEPPKILYEAAINIAHIVDNGTFKDLLFEIASNYFLERHILVFGREKKTDNWILLQDGLTDYLHALIQLNFKIVRFLLESSNIQETSPVSLDVNSVLMSNAKQLHLPKKLTRGNSHDRLFNELIDLFEEKKVGWSSGIQDSRGKIFIEHLSNAIWYINPYIKLLQNRAYHMPSLFKQLAIYKSGSTYNTFYFTSHHKKEKISQQKLLEYCKLLEYSTSEIWGNLTTMMREYVEHLEKSAQLTYNAHHSTTIVRTSNKYSKLTIITGVLNINPKYKALEMILTEKDLYEFIEILEFLPSENIEYNQGNYLGSINYAWRIIEFESHNNEHETRNAQTLAAINERIPQYITREIRKSFTNKDFFILELNYR